MAILKARRLPLDMEALGGVPGAPVRVGSDLVTISGGGLTERYLGSFGEAGGGITGTIAALSRSAGETLLFTVTDIGQAATAYFRMLGSDGFVPALSFLLSGRDTVQGAAGNDRLFAWDGNDRVVGFGGADVIYAGRQNDSVTGGSGRDSLYGEAGNDRMSGDPGDDTLFAGGGADRLLGGDGNDLAYGEAGADVIAGNSGRDTLYAGTGADRMTGGDDADRLFGESGADSLNGQGGDDALTGGTGNDTLRGGDGADSLFGEAGQDRLSGDAGDDQMFGSTGNDTLQGGAGRDTLFGDDGADVVLGGAGADVLNGGAEADHFVFESVAAIGLGATADLLADHDAQTDRIDLSAIDADPAVPGNQAFAFIGSALFSGRAGEVRHADDIVAGDTTGDGVADFELRIGNAVVLGAGDFIL